MAGDRLLHLSAPTGRGNRPSTAMDMQPAPYKRPLKSPADCGEAVEGAPASRPGSVARGWNPGCGIGQPSQPVQRHPSSRMANQMEAHASSTMSRLARRQNFIHIHAKNIRV